MIFSWPEKCLHRKRWLTLIDFSGVKVSYLSGDNIFPTKISLISLASSLLVSACVYCIYLVFNYFLLGKRFFSPDMYFLPVHFLDLVFCIYSASRAIYPVSCVFLYKKSFSVFNIGFITSKNWQICAYFLEVLFI